MVSKSTFAVALFAVSAQLVAAAPPACLLAGVNTVPSPGDLSAVCGTSQAAVLKYIDANCGNFKTEAVNAFSDACKTVGKSITTSSMSGSSSSTSSASGSVSTGASSSVIYSYGGSNATATVMSTSTYYDQSCGCMKTAVMGPTGGMSTAVVTGGSSAASPTVTGSTRASGTGSSPSATFTGAASKNVGGALMAVAAVAGLAIAL